MSLSFRGTPRHLHLLPVITSTATMMFFSMECLTIKSFLSPLVPAPTISAFWKAYTLNSGLLGIRYAYNALSAISGMMCYYSLRKTNAGVKEFYAVGVVFSLMHFAFEPWRAKINKKIIDGPSVKAKDGARELLDAQNTIRQLVDLPAWLAFTCGFARLCRLTSEVKGWSFFLPSS